MSGGRAAAGEGVVVSGPHGPLTFALLGAVLFLLVGAVAAILGVFLLAIGPWAWAALGLAVAGAVFGLAAWRYG